MNEQNTNFANSNAMSEEVTAVAMHDKCHCRTRCPHCLCGHHHGEKAESVSNVESGAVAAMP